MGLGLQNQELERTGTRQTRANPGILRQAPLPPSRAPEGACRNRFG